jgi:GT2 family glycosyltransferase
VAAPSVSIVVVTYDSAALLPSFVDALAAAATGVDHELVVADNASRDGSVALVRSLRPGATVVEVGANRGYAAGVNAGLAVARGRDAVLVCNPDVRLGAGSLARLLDALHRPGVGITAPRTTTTDGRLVRSLRRDATVRRVVGEAVLGGTRASRFTGWSQIVGDDDAYETGHEVDWASGAVLLCSRACVDAVGRWDESFFMYSEEVDYQLRAREHGYAVWYVPDATAVHDGGDLHTSPELWALQMRNTVKLFRRRHGAAHTAAFRGAWIGYEIIRSPSANGAIHRRGVRALLSPLDGKAHP